MTYQKLILIMSIMARDLHVVMVPWLAFGHMIPFLKLSTALSQAGIRVSFISTPKNIQRLPTVPPGLDPLVKLVAFDLPKVEGLPEGAEATVDINMSEIQYLKIAYDLLKPQFRDFVSNHSTDWIVVDFAPVWAVDVAQEFGVPQIMFSVFSGLLLTFFGPLDYLKCGEVQDEHWPDWESFTTPQKWVTIPSSVAYRPHEAKGIFPGLFSPNASGMADIDRFAITIGASQAVAIRSCREYEGEHLDLAEKIYQKPVIPVGLLPPEKRDKGEGEIFRWLDQHKSKSVVYVGFGTEVKLSRDQVFSIAHGLELANLPFFWALRKPMWAINDDDALPLGFSGRIAEFGMVYMGWAPQLEILAHPSVGGSLFHSGWGSIVETLQHGHTLVVLPLVNDQGLNARFLVEKCLGVEVDTREEDGRFDGNDVAKALRMAMVDEEGERVRLNCSKMKTVFGNDLLNNGHYMRGFVQYLRNGNIS